MTKANVFLFAVLAVVGATWLFASPNSNANTTKLIPNNEVIKPDDGLTRLTLKEFDAMVKAEARPTLLFFYASWCPHCRIQMPQIMEMETRRSEDVRVLYVSIDQDPNALASFIENEHADEEFTPYILAEGEGRKFAHYLTSRNSNFRGGVPYSAVFDPKGRLTHEFRGRAPIAEIEKAF